MRWPDAPLCINFLTKKIPYKVLGADSEEKREPASDIDTVVVDSLKALDPEWPIREADIGFPARPRSKPYPLGRSPASAASGAGRAGALRLSLLCGYNLGQPL